MEIALRKFLLRALAMLVLCTLIAPALVSCGKETGFSLPRLENAAQMSTAESIRDMSREIRGVWIASVFNIDFPSKASLDPWSLMGEIDSILDSCEKNGLNTVFFQVRPACDALYKSSLYPVSSFLSTDGTLPFDVLEYTVEEAHKRNISVHAWVNPLRVTVNKDSESDLPEDSPAALHPEWCVKYADGKLYLNAGLPEVRAFVAEGVREIVNLYDVDGVVFDDYFYPYPVDGADFNDGDAYDRYGGELSVADWRRENINSLVRECRDAVKATDGTVAFGVSPGGVWRNNDGSNGGSDTRGFETYVSLYCDSVAWINGGYIDYIAPQIYWSFDGKAAPYDVLVDWWTRAVDGTSVKLLIAHGAYRYEDGDWESPEGEMTRQVKYARESVAYRGSVYYGYEEIKNNVHGVASEIKLLCEDDIIYCSYQKTPYGIAFVSHENGAEVSVGSLTLTGVSDPTCALYLDGQKVTRGRGGTFELTLKVSKGKNVFEFEANGVEYELTLIGK